MSYPSTIDSPGGTAAQGTTLLTAIDHALDHRTLGSAVVNIENTLGTTAGTGVIASFLAGQSALPIQLGTLGTTVAKGTINNSTFGTPSITGGTANNQILGTPTIQAPTINGVGTASGTIINGIYNNSTLGTPIINVWNGWIQANDTWTILGTAASLATITVTATASNKYDKGDKVNFQQGGTNMYGYITSIPSGTSFLITGGTDFTYGTTSITIPQYSKIITPNGFPDWFNYNPTFGGFSSTPTLTYARFKVTAKQCFVKIMTSAGGTSNATTFTISLPISTAQTLSSAVAGLSVDNGSGTVNIMRGDYTAASTTLNLYRDLIQTAWTASGVKYADLQLDYEI